MQFTRGLTSCWFAVVAKLHVYYHATLCILIAVWCSTSSPLPRLQGNSDTLRDETCPQILLIVTVLNNLHQITKATEKFSNTNTDTT